MEPPKKQVRAIIPLLKPRITNITERGFDIMLGAEFGSPTRFHVSVDTRRFDIRDGDILTLYTELLIKNALPS